jgi:peptidoglycan hydrolase CwlO-like protein
MEINNKWQYKATLKLTDLAMIVQDFIWEAEDVEKDRDEKQKEIEKLQSKLEELEGVGNE